MADRLAVIVGINKYSDPDIKELQGAVRDAEEMRESLEGPGNFKILHYLIGSDATSESIRRALYDLLWKSCDPCELALFYFSGHGLLDGHREPYLAPYDLNSKELLVRGIKMLELKQILVNSSNRDNAMVVLDCCHSGMITGGSDRSAGDSPPLYASLRVEETQEADTASQPRAMGTGKFILASAGPNEKAREQEFSHRIRREGDKPHYHGLFTFHLLEALNGEAAESDNEVYLPRLRQYLDERMQNYKDHDAYYFGFGKGLEPKIRLVTACRKQEIELWLQEAEAEIGEATFDSLIAAVLRLSQALQSAPESSKAIILKKNLEDRLFEYYKPVLPFLNANKYSKGWHRKYPGALRKLETNLGNLCFEVIAADLADQALLIELCRAANKDLELTIFEKTLANAEPRPQPRVLPSAQGK